MRRWLRLSVGVIAIATLAIAARETQSAAAQRALTIRHDRVDAEVVRPIAQDETGQVLDHGPEYGGFDVRHGVGVSGNSPDEVISPTSTTKRGPEVPKFGTPVFATQSGKQLPKQANAPQAHVGQTVGDHLRISPVSGGSGRGLLDTPFIILLVASPHSPG